jgi:hypothetical protein
MSKKMKDLGSTDFQNPSDEEPKNIVTEGNGKMQPVHLVTGKSVDDVTGYIRTFKK